MKLMWNLSVICQKCRSIYFKMWSDMFYRTTKRYHNTQTISGESVNKYCREDTIESPSYFFRIWNLQNRSVAAQFGGCFKWLKRHCRSCWHTFQTKWNLGLHIYCGFFLSMATSLASFGQKKVSSRNVSIRIFKCTRWPHILLYESLKYIYDKSIYLWQCYAKFTFLEMKQRKNKIKAWTYRKRFL